MKVLPLLLVVTGLLLVLANYTILVEGHIVVGPPLTDADGNMIRDESGNPVAEINPSYLKYKREQAVRTACFLGVAAIGLFLIVADCRRRR